MCVGRMSRSESVGGLVGGLVNGKGGGLSNRRVVHGYTGRVGV